MHYQVRYKTGNVIKKIAKKNTTFMDLALWELAAKGKGLDEQMQ